MKLSEVLAKRIIEGSTLGARLRRLTVELGETQ